MDAYQFMQTRQNNYRYLTNLFQDDHRLPAMTEHRYPRYYDWETIVHTRIDLEQHLNPTERSIRIGKIVEARREQQRVAREMEVNRKEAELRAIHNAHMKEERAKEREQLAYEKALRRIARESERERRKEQQEARERMAKYEQHMKERLRMQDDIAKISTPVAALPRKRRKGPRGKSKQETIEQIIFESHEFALAQGWREKDAFIHLPNDPLPHWANRHQHRDGTVYYTTKYGQRKSFNILDPTSLYDPTLTGGI